MSNALAEFTTSENYLARSYKSKLCILRQFKERDEKDHIHDNFVLCGNLRWKTLRYRISSQILPYFHKTKALASLVSFTPVFSSPEHKGYWRAYQAVKGAVNGAQQALPYVSSGLRVAYEDGHGTQQDAITFLTELCILLPKIVNNAITNPILEQLAYPNVFTEEEIWTKVFQNLASNNCWNSLRMLVLGDVGPNCDLQGSSEEADFAGVDVDCTGVDIGGLLEIPVPDLKRWGLDLAESLIDQDAPVEKIAERFKKPALHVGVEIALKTDSTILLDSILYRYDRHHNSAQKNAQNAEGQTAFHIAVSSVKVYQYIGEEIVTKLLEGKCDCNIRDKKGKRPIDLLHLKATNVYILLRKASKTVAELRAELETVKSKGNDALRQGNNGEALIYYKQALEIAEQSRELHKEAAVVYSNTAKVYHSLGDWKNALTNAIAAVSCDNTYHKGHWWKGKVLCQMSAPQDGFTAYMEGFNYSTGASDIKLNFLLEAVTQLPSLNPQDLIACYGQLNFVDKEIWPVVLQKLSTNGAWNSIGHLVFGPKFDPKLFKAALKEKSLDKFCTGVAGMCSKDSLDLKTVFPYIRREGYSADATSLLDVLLVVICKHGYDLRVLNSLREDDRDRPLHAVARFALLTGERYRTIMVLLFVVICKHGYDLKVLNSLTVDDRDRPLHAVARFALLIGKTAFLSEVLRQPLASLNNQSVNGLGMSIFHTVTQHRPLPPEPVLVKVIKLFLEKGFSPMIQDNRGILAVDYLDKSYSGDVFDLFFRKFNTFSWDEVNEFREQGNQRYKSGDILESIELYTMAIEMVENQPMSVLRGIPGKDIAVLYGNRAEGYLKLAAYDAALTDAKTCVSYHGHWYKAHLRVAKAMKGLKRIEDSYKAFINAYKDVDQTVEDRVKIEILSELTLVCKQLPRHKYNLKEKLKEFPEGEGHIWAKTSYDLIKKGDWDRAAIAYNQFAVGKRKNPHFTFSLTPMCNLDKMRVHPWSVDLMRYFLDYGADKKTLTLVKGDTYLHAAVKICLLVVKNGSFLDWLLRKYKDTHLVDKEGNTPLHAAAKVRSVLVDVRYSVVIVLLQANINPSAQNHHGQLAIDLLPSNETKNAEILRMAMYRAQNLEPALTNQQESKKTSSRPIEVFKQILKNTCEECENLLQEAKTSLQNDEVTLGYGTLNSIFTKTHKNKTHDGVVNQAVSAIVEKLGEKSVPEIPQNLTTIPKEFYQRIVEGLIQNQKWMQLHNVVRKYRLVKGSDQLKRFASNLSIVPVICDPVLQGSEDDLMQVINNMLNSGASIGSDCGQKALMNAKEAGHFKVVADLIRRGADTSHFSLKQGDTPIHAIVTLVLEKERALDMLEFVFSQFEKNPGQYPHLNPCQQNKVGDSLFHLVAKAKDNQTVRQVTEFLCKKNLSARYFNKERKLPISYITKKNDRRLQFIRLAATVEPVGQQFYVPHNENSEGESSDDDLEDHGRNDEAGNMELPSKVVEKIKHESERDQMRRRIEEMIRAIPEYKPVKVVNQASGNLVDQTNDVTVDTREINVSSGTLLDQTTDATADISVIYQSGGNQTNNTTAHTKDTIDDRNTLGGTLLQETNDKKAENRDTRKETLKKEAEFESSYEEGDSFYEDAVEEFVVEKDSGESENTKAEVMTEITEKGADTGINIPDGSSTVAHTEKDKVRTDNDQTKLIEENNNNDMGSKSKATLVEVKQEKTDKLIEDLTEKDGDETQAEEGVGDVLVEEASYISDDEYEEEEDDETGTGYNFEAEVFDNMEWEVECTADVWKTLRDSHVIPELKRRIVRKIQLLASGDWQPVLCKKLRNVPKTLDLFEAKFSKGSRIIWEKAIAFSPRCSESAERRLQSDFEGPDQPVRGGRIYSEIIRVWDIVFDHDKIYRSVDKIKKSHLRGEECIIQKKLKGIKADTSQLNLTHGNRIYPKMFAENDVPLEKILEQQEDMQQFFPPASSNETEYHILKFYSFSSTLVSLVLQNVDTKVDFPFRVTDLEHAIINLSSKAPILLLGRSGTGKTTCCLYRLWSQFLRYWNKAKEADSPLIPRCVEFVHTELTEGSQEDEQSGESSAESSSEEEISEEEGAVGGDAESSSSETNQPIMEQYDHMHQIFITKNLVLCSEVQKNFRELSHAEELMREHVEKEEEDIPNKLQEVNELSYPLFLTSRQLLLMLDASIGEPYFFERKEDGSLKSDIAGWTDDGPLSVLSLLDEDSDGEMEDGYQQLEEQEPDNLDVDAATTSTKKKVDPRREITYQVFVEDVWPKIKKKLSYHPSLVWTEIMSFIKGSFEALSIPSGYLTKDDYLKLGKKRAPNFSAEREPIHQFFKRYEHFKKQHQLFDETDLVHNIYGRLKQLEQRPWVVHQIYVDETQDFTQAELCLLIRICQNPNDMFLTGDTAQSIMRGISFRFSDLRSLFYHAKQSMQAMGKTSAVEVPRKVYQLVHNYRSHAGILSLASSVLELMVEFFPESFDRLQRDQGLFNGPQPILLESCSFSDLAVLLRGNKRKTSHIEFGAHQAILVVNETARETIPEELRLGLVLTIYEAKGLEFDDVLLYNFFKDSQANKEWRVVTEYLERLQEQKETSGAKESLVEIDEEVLNETNRPRPLEFDPNQHKVLNSELKHLYTALTRARVNVWIFDEDLDKRAPIFEYFRARKLVKSVTVSEINEESLAETVFAEKSSVEDWVRRGEDFTRHSLYSVAAKCYGMAGDKEKENISLAHVQAVKASKLKDNPKEMRREFLKAAEMYLNCNRPAKAAICLQNARERELAAELFEKLGQYERAADVYRKLNHFIASSRCYEQLGNYNKAVEVLCENENFDMAIDTLKRYRIRVQECTQRNPGLWFTLLANKPADYYTEERLSYRAAEKFHKLKMPERMLDSINGITKVGDRVEFLEKRGYVREAAEILKTDGDLKRAAELLLMNGMVKDATTLARNVNDDETLGYCILVHSRIFMARQREESAFSVEMPPFQQTEVAKFMSEGIELFQACKCNDEFGELCLLMSELPNQYRFLVQGWKAFKSSKPVQNDVGLVECAIRLLEHEEGKKDVALKSVVETVGHMFAICCALSKPNDAVNLDKVSKCLKLYGLLPHGQNELVIHLKERPMCLNIFKGMLKRTGQERRTVVTMDKSDTLDTIICNILQRSHEWITNIWQALHDKREQNKVCGYFEAGLTCPIQGNEEKVCKRLHEAATQENLRKVIDTDLLMITLEGEIQNGAQRLKRVCSAGLRTEAESFLVPEETDSRGLHKPSDLREQFEACWILFDDLRPYSGHPIFIAENSGEFTKYLQRDTRPVTRIRDFLFEMWKAKSTTQSKKILKCAALRETEVVFVMEFGYRLFGMKNRFKIDPPIEVISKFERQIEHELDLGKMNKRSFDYLSLVTWEEKRKIYADFIAKRAIEAYNYISSNPNPYEAVFSFSKFVILLRHRAEVTLLPDLSHYAMWLEFFLTVGIILMAKLKSKDLPGFLFILPSNYIALVKFIEATFPNPSLARVLIGIDMWEPSYKHYMNYTSRLQDRLKYISFGVCGFGHNINILNVALEKTEHNPAFYSVVERIIILQMLLLLNMGKAMPIECETSLMKSLTTLKIPEDGPDRLKRLASYFVHDVKGIAGVSEALSSLLKCRMKGEELLICRWLPRTKEKVVTTKLDKEKIFSTTFLNARTYAAIHGFGQVDSIEDEDHAMDDQLTQEEIDRRIQSKQQQDVVEKQNDAARKICRFFRRIVAMKKARREISEKKHEVGHGELRNRFASIRITDKHCGYCGVYFEDKLRELWELHHSTIVGDQSVMNVHNRGDGHWNMASAGFPTSPPREDGNQHQFQSDVWGRGSHYEGGFVSQDRFAPMAPSSPEFGHQEQDFPWQRKVSSQQKVDPNSILYEYVKVHKQSPEHINKQLEFKVFSNKCLTKFLPKLDTVREFLETPDYRLDDKVYAEKQYVNRYVEIERVQKLLPILETEIMKLFERREWSNTGHMEQMLMELGTDFGVVLPYVEQEFNKKEEEDRAKKAAMASKMSRRQREFSDEEEEGVYEAVVEEPKFTKPRKYYRRGKGKRR